MGPPASGFRPRWRGQAATVPRRRPSSVPPEHFPPSARLNPSGGAGYYMVRWFGVRAPELESLACARHGAVKSKSNGARRRMDDAGGERQQVWRLGARARGADATLDGRDNEAARLARGGGLRV